MLACVRHTELPCCRCVAGLDSRSKIPSSAYVIETEKKICLENQLVKAFNVVDNMVLQPK